MTSTETRNAMSLIEHNLNRYRMRASTYILVAFASIWYYQSVNAQSMAWPTASIALHHFVYESQVQHESRLFDRVVQRMLREDHEPCMLLFLVSVAQFVGWTLSCVIQLILKSSIML